MARRARLNPVESHPAARAAVRSYTALHDGLDPERVELVKAPRPPRYLAQIGRVHAIEYEKLVDDDGDGTPNKNLELYRHEFRPDAAPDIDFDDRQQMHFKGGHYRVTERGITDMSHRRGRKGMFGFIPRVNPDYSTAQILVRGTGLALLAVGSNKVFDTLMDPIFATDRTRSLVKGAAQIGTGLLFAKMKYPFIAAGFVAGGVLEVAQLGYRTFGLDAYEATARDRVAAFVLSMRRPAADAGAAGGTHGLSSPAATAGLPAAAPADRSFMPDLGRIRAQMAQNG